MLVSGGGARAADSACRGTAGVPGASAAQAQAQEQAQERRTPCEGEALPSMRFLLYAEAGGEPPPHLGRRKPETLSTQACSPTDTGLSPY